MEKTLYTREWRAIQTELYGIDFERRDECCVADCRSYEAPHYPHFCETHGKQRYGLSVRRSRIPNAGLGCFAEREFQLGECLGVYGGEPLYLDDYLERYGPLGYDQSEYCMQVGDYFIDAREPRSCILRYVNSCSSNVRHFAPTFHFNATFVLDANANPFQLQHPRLFSTRRILVGEEILVFYGDQFWSALPQMGRRSAPGTGGVKRPVPFDHNLLLQVRLFRSPHPHYLYEYAWNRTAWQYRKAFAAMSRAWTKHLCRHTDQETVPFAAQVYAAGGTLCLGACTRVTRCLVAHPELLDKETEHTYPAELLLACIMLCHSRHVSRPCLKTLPFLVDQFLQHYVRLVAEYKTCLLELDVLIGDLHHLVVEYVM